jgi:hypothetical protein
VTATLAELACRPIRVSMKFLHMGRLQMGKAYVAMAAVIGATCYINRIPDLSSTDAADIILRASEFNRYARLVQVESIHHAKKSMDFVSFGRFTFRYLNSPADAPPIEANADFRYHEGKWYLNQFDYGCPRDCHIVDVNDGPDKRK